MARRRRPGDRSILDAASAAFFVQPTAGSSPPFGHGGREHWGSRENAPLRDAPGSPRFPGLFQRGHAEGARHAERTWRQKACLTSFLFLLRIFRAVVSFVCAGDTNPETSIKQRNRGIQGFSVPLFYPLFLCAPFVFRTWYKDDGANRHQGPGVDVQSSFKRTPHPHAESGKRDFDHTEGTEGTEYSQDQFSVSSVPSACECCFSGFGITQKSRRNDEERCVLRVLRVLRVRTAVELGWR